MNKGRADPSRTRSRKSIARLYLVRDPLFDLYYWKKIAIALLINALTVPTMIILLFWSGIIEEPLSDVIRVFQSSYPLFFVPLDKIFKFFSHDVLRAAVFEELIYRGPIRVGLAFLLISIKNRIIYYLSIYPVWIFGLYLNFQWATHHTAHEFMWLTVFVAGIPWLWLAIETKRIWPSIICHSAANLSIYFLVKAYQFLY